MRSGFEERRERRSFALSRAGGRLGRSKTGRRPRHKSRYPQTKQQKPPRRIKFLQERFDHSWDVHAVGQAVALMCATRADARSGLRAILPVGPVPGSRDQHWG
jgi:hypothetical protein